MKKLCLVLLTLIFFAIPLNVSALEDRFETAHDFYSYFMAHHKFPDYVCGVYSENGGLNHLTIMVLEGEEGEKGKEEILYWIQDDSTVTFSYGKYSYNYLRSIQDEAMTYFKKGAGIVMAGVHDNRNLVEIGVLKEKKDDELTKQAVLELTEKYDDAISIYYTDPVYTLDDKFVPDHMISNPHSKPFSLWLFVAVLLVLCVTGFAFWLVISNRRKKILVTAQGQTIEANQKLSAKNIEAIVKDSKAEVSSDLEERILKEIENKS